MKGFRLDLDHLIQNYVVVTESEGRSPRTSEFYRDNLKVFLRFLVKNDLPTTIDKIGLDEVRMFIRYQQSEAVRYENHPLNHHQGRLSPATIHAEARSIRAFFNWLLREGYISVNPIAAFRPPKIPKKLIEPFTQEQVDALLQAPDLETYQGFRHYAIMVLLLDTGIRLTELLHLKLTDIDIDQYYLKVMGKGSKERILPIGAQTRKVLMRYISMYRPEPATHSIQELFLTRDGLPMERRSVQHILSRLAIKAGITGVRCSPHTFRHTFAKQYLMNGGDVFTLQAILGHSTLDIVKLYVNLVDRDVLGQHRKFSPVDVMVVKRRGRLPGFSGALKSRRPTE